MKKRNVLHLVEYLYLGGIERLLEQLSSKSASIANLHFFSYETDEISGIGKQIQDRGMPVFTYKKKPGRDWQLLRDLIAVIKIHKIEVIHTHDFGPMEYAVLLKIRFPKIRLIHTQHTVIHFIRHRKYTLFFEFASYFYYRIISVSQFVKDTILKHCRMMKQSALVVISNGVNIDIFTPSFNILEKNRLNLVCVSRISNEKNLKYLFNTCRLLKDAGIPFVFHHAGTAKKAEALEEIKIYLKAYQLEENVILHGFKVDIKSVLDLGDVFLSASITEGHPVAVLEAMACEKICFCSDISPHRELGDQAVHLFDIEDEFSLLNKLKKHFDSLSCLVSSENKEVETRRCVSARKNIVDNFSLEKMVNNYVEQYN
jgi:glycosyltransferase involved in cell wall biosynthesis